MNATSEKAGTEERLPDGSIQVRLSRPIPVPDKNGIGSRSDLVFREPTAEDVDQAGCPVTLDLDAGGETKVNFDEKKMTAMIARLSDVPLPFIRKMRANDWISCAWAIAPFSYPGHGLNFQLPGARQVLRHGPGRVLA